jgi:hypothetical protein
MEEEGSRDDVVRTGNHFYKHILKYEIVAALAIATGIMLTLLDKPGRLLVTGSLLMMAIIYFLLAFSNIPVGKKTWNFIIKLNSWLTSITLVGMIFMLHKLPLASTFALLGSIPLLLVTLIMLISKSRQQGNGQRSLITIIRSFSIGLFVLLYYLLWIH